MMVDKMMMSTKLMDFQFSMGQHSSDALKVVHNRGISL